MTRLPRLNPLLVLNTHSPTFLQTGGFHLRTVWVRYKPTNLQPQPLSPPFLHWAVPTWSLSPSASRYTPATMPSSLNHQLFFPLYILPTDPHFHWQDMNTSLSFFWTSVLLFKDIGHILFVYLCLSYGLHAVRNCKLLVDKRSAVSFSLICSSDLYY